jgi:hypothetical protein
MTLGKGPNNCRNPAKKASSPLSVKVLQVKNKKGIDAGYPKETFFMVWAVNPLSRNS